MRFFIVKSRALIFVSIMFILAFLLMIFSPPTTAPTSGLKTTFAVNRYQTQQHLVGLTFEITSISDSVFATGEVARQSPEMLQSIIDEGHEIAIMGFSYTDQSAVSAEQFRDSVRATSEQFDASDIEYIAYYRPPYLKTNTEMIAALSSFSYLTIVGDVIFLEDDMRAVATQVDDATTNLKTGSIIRLPPINGETIEILEELFDILETETKSAVKLSSLLPKEGYIISNTGVLSDNEL